MPIILIKTDSHHKINRKRIKKTIEGYLSKKRANGKIEVSVNIVGDRMMKILNTKYRTMEETTPVLTFPQYSQNREKPFVSSPDDVLRLGDIVISYPQAINIAQEENKLVDDVVDELIEHGMSQLFGNNHE
ncbi:rRNA maturation RNase YbeY [Candidatus Gottesmanbacteria bacterium RBG_13_37_7]|uniref:rRNA maturation RNase YbeY n=1 Tax=Candidatus Gottesmanbacteria bacterium RBG_13_37_7 TaxID=1798369 RepID=A0A1F5YH21_9BACT|nr:MAG: rRNA maturation RNase YbeY [Candidatus Gottesmanbacteria bacterium RBG_13_37_7]